MRLRDVRALVGHLGAFEGHHLPNVDPTDHQPVVVDAFEEPPVVLERLRALALQPVQEIDPGQVEAIQATGANSVEAAIYGIVPQIKPAFIGVATYRWDINVRASTIIGFVGAGGIGVELNTSINFFAWGQVLTILIAILGIVIISEVVSAYMRRKVR